jgi:hypothetical protein
MSERESGSKLVKQEAADYAAGTLRANDIRPVSSADVLVNMLDFAELLATAYLDGHASAERKRSAS